MLHSTAYRDSAVADTATIIEVNGIAQNLETYSASWGYRIDATGEIVSGKDDGEYWSEWHAEEEAIFAGYEISN